MESQNIFDARREKLNKFLKVHLLDTPKRRKVIKDIAKIGDYHVGIPLDKIEEIMDKHGLVLLQEDNTRFSAIFCGREGTARIAFGYKATEHMVNDIPSYIPFENSMVILSWYKMTYKYEVITYLS
jgi:hypothetical protein